MEEVLKANLRAVFEAFATHSRFSASTIWARATKDARFMTRISSGAPFTVKRYDAAMKWFSSNWPEEAAWPAGVARPTAAGDSEQTPAAVAAASPPAQHIEAAE